MAKEKEAVTLTAREKEIVIRALGIYNAELFTFGKKADRISVQTSAAKQRAEIEDITSKLL